MPTDEVVSAELARHLAEVSHALGRQVGVLVDRDGTIRNVIVGTAERLELPDVGRLRGGAGRFRGLRLVHTHLKGESLTQDDLNDLALLRLDMIAMIDARTPSPGRIEVAHVLPGNDAHLDTPFQHFDAPDIHRLHLDFGATMRALEEEFAALVRGQAGRVTQERALVIGIVQDEHHFEETLELVAAADVAVAGTIRQRRGQIHPRTVVGSGKLQEIILESMRRNATVAIFDMDIKPAQARAFEDATGLKAIDRTQLILDIFAQRAASRDGKLQVELAQLKYSLPRLTDKDAGLSRLSGGIGGRGPGETVMEIGRRRIRDRIASLEKEVGRLSKQRDLRRRRRRDNQLPVLSIVGYTNAGKSTLLNSLTNSNVEAADKLFMTLDPTSRRLRFPREGEVIITDTVGFIESLPKDLLAAFKATLEELGDATLLLHVADASDPRLDQKITSVNKVLAAMDLGDTPQLLVLNKIDRLDPLTAAALINTHKAIGVSALKKVGLREFIEKAEERLHGTF